MYTRKKHLKSSYDRQIIALFKETCVAKSNGEVIILTGVYVHAQYKLSPSLVSNKLKQQ